MDETKIRGWRFAKGEAVPCWLLDQEPTLPGARRGAITFSIDAVVVELGDRYVVLAATAGGFLDHYIGITRAEKVIVFAPGRSVHLPTRWTSVAGADDRATGDAPTFAVAPTPAPISWWRRLLRAMAEA